MKSQPHSFIVCILLVENEINGKDEADECCQMVPTKCLSVEEQSDKDCEHCQRDDFLDHFQLHDGERTSITVKADAVGWNLAAVFG